VCLKTFVNLPLSPPNLYGRKGKNSAYFVIPPLFCSYEVHSLAYFYFIFAGKSAIPILMASIYSSDSSDTQEPKTPNRSLDLSYLRLDNLAMGRTMEQIALVPNESTESSECQTQQVSEKTGLYETILLLHNDLVTMPVEVLYFHNLRLLDLSSNSLTFLPDVIIELKHLTSLIIKNNCLDENGLPKNFGRLRLRELNLSGNHFTRFPEQVYDMTTLKYLYIGGGSITGFSGRIAKLQRFLYIIYL